MARPSTALAWLLALVLPLSCCAGSGFRQRTVRMTIKNVKQGEYLFASKTTLDHSRRQVLTWVPGFDARKDSSGQWDVTFLPGGRVTIWNVKYREPLYAGYRNHLDQKRRRVLTWRRTKQYIHHPWQIRSLGSGRVTLKSVRYGEYLFAGWKKLDPLRRYALTWIPGFNPWKDKTGQWYMDAIHHPHASMLDELVNQSLAASDEDADFTSDTMNQTMAVAGDDEDFASGFVNQTTAATDEEGEHEVENVESERPIFP